MTIDPKDPSTPVDITLANATRETLTGADARTVHAEVSNVTRETLVKGPSLYVTEVTREALADVPNEPVNVERVVGYTSELTATHRVTIPAADYRSSIDTTALQALIAQKFVPPPWPYGTASAGTLRYLATVKATPTAWPNSGISYNAGYTEVTLHRNTTPAGDTHSTISLRTHRTLVALSRVHAYVPVSGVYGKTHAMLSAQARRLGPPIALFATGTYQVLTSARTPVTGISATRVARELSLVTLDRIDASPISDLDVARQLSLVTLDRTPETPVSQAIVPAQTTLVATHRKTDPLTATIVTHTTSLAATLRDAGSPLSMEIVTLMQAHATVQRVAPAIGDVWSASPVAQTVTSVALGRWTINPDLVTDPTMGRHVGATRVQYTMYRHVPSPTDVYDPELGHLARGVYNLTTTRRPIDLLVERTVSEFGQALVLGDDHFPPQSAITTQSVLQSLAVSTTDLPDANTPLSDLTAIEAHANAVLGDTTLSTLTPMSDLSVREVFMAAAIGDTALPTGDTPLSDLTVSGVNANIVLGDTTLPTGDTPLSAEIVSGVSQPITLGDTAFPSSDTPLSAVQSMALASSVTMSDGPLTGVLPVSNTYMHNVVQPIVLRDNRMLILPARPTGPRPVVSIVIY